MVRSGAPALSVADVGLQRVVRGITRQGMSRGIRPLVLRNLLLCLEPDGPSSDAMSWAIDLAKRFGARVHVVSVAITPERVTRYDHDPKGIVLRDEDVAKRTLIAAAKDLAEQGVKATFAFAAGWPVKEILKQANDRGSDLIILGSRPRERGQSLFFGRTADALKHRAKCSILIARGKPPAKNLLLPVDGSGLSQRAANLGVRLATMHDARAHVLHVVWPSSFTARRFVRREINASLSELELLGWQRPTVKVDIQVGRPAPTILSTATAIRSNLIVMGSHGWGGLQSLALGGVSNEVSHLASASLLLVKGDA